MNLIQSISSSLLGHTVQNSAHPMPRARTIHAMPSPSICSGARALYLDPATAKSASATADALVISSVLAATQRYPVARLARVVSSITVNWSGCALALCLVRGISIAWLDSHGQVIGAAIPQKRGHISASTALQVLLDGPSGLQHYNDWLRSRRMQVFQHWLGTQDAPLSFQAANEIKRSWVYASQHSVHLPTTLRGLCLAYVSAQLAHHCLPPVMWAGDAQPIDLDEDLCSLLWSEMNLCSGNLANALRHQQSEVSLFESWSARNASALLLHINSLQRCAQRALQE